MFSLIDRLVGVIDDPAHAEIARQRLIGLGIPASEIEVLSGEADAQRLDSTGEGGWWDRLVRVSQYMVADQSTEFVMYDAALRDDRAVIAVRLKDRRHKPDATRILQDAGAHLLSFHGRMQTEEISRWRGPELVQPPVLPDRGSTSR